MPRARLADCNTGLIAIEATLEHAVEAGMDASMGVLDAGMASTPGQMDLPSIAPWLPPSYFATARHHALSSVLLMFYDSMILAVAHQVAASKCPMRVLLIVSRKTHACCMLHLDLGAAILFGAADYHSMDCCCVQVLVQERQP